MNSPKATGLSKPNALISLDAYRLSELFPPTIGYIIDDLSDVLAGARPAEFGAVYVSKLEKNVKEFKNAFTTAPYFGMYVLVKDYLDLIEYPLTELKKYFIDSSDSCLTPKGAAVFLHFISEHLEVLAQIAKEIDQIAIS